MPIDLSEVDEKFVPSELTWFVLAREFVARIVKFVAAFKTDRVKFVEFVP